MKPLDAAQLSAWSHYIDYMDAKGDEAETRHLFERCLVACGRYPGEAIWMRYSESGLMQGCLATCIAVVPVLAFPWLRSSEMLSHAVLQDLHRGAGEAQVKASIFDRWGSVAMQISG